MVHDFLYLSDSNKNKNTDNKSKRSDNKLTTISCLALFNSSTTPFISLIWVVKTAFCSSSSTAAFLSVRSSASISELLREIS